MSRTHARGDGVDVRRAARASGERRAAAVSVVVGDGIHGRGAEWGAGCRSRCALHGLVVSRRGAMRGRWDVDDHRRGCTCRVCATGRRFRRCANGEDVKRGRRVSDGVVERADQRERGTLLDARAQGDA